MPKSSDNHNNSKQIVFSDAVSDITPLVQDKIIPSSVKVRCSDKQNKTSYNSMDQEDFSIHLSDDYEPFTDTHLSDDLNYHHSSISMKQYKKIKSGAFATEDFLDLHGLSKLQAQNKLKQFLSHSMHQNYQRITIMPGIGLGILRRSLNIWLRQLPVVLAFAESPNGSGGKGVIRVLLKRRKHDSRSIR